MDNHFVIEPQSECKDLGGFYTQEFCLPDVEICDETPRTGLLNDCDAVWNCVRCQGDYEYFTPYAPGDKIQIQTLFLDFYNPDRTDPATGWGLGGSAFVAATLRDNQGNAISVDVSEFTSRKIVGWNGTNTYQILEIDTSLTPFDTNKCWTLEIRSYDSDNFVIQTLCSQSFVEVSNCYELLEIRSKWRGFDCAGNWHGNPVNYVGDNFKFDNRLKYWARMVDTGTNIAKTIVGNTRTKSEITRLVRLCLTKLVPPYTKNILMDEHLGAPQFFIDDVEYTKDRLTFDNEIDTTNMFKIEVELEKICEINDSC